MAVTSRKKAKPNAEKPAYRGGSAVPHPIDVHVGKRVRTGRRLLGMTLDTLASRLGVTLPQLHNYEVGASRLTASRLATIADILGLPIGFFFAELNGGAYPPAEPALRERMEQPETIELIRLYYAIPDANVRHQFLAMTKAVAGASRTATADRQLPLEAPARARGVRERGDDGRLSQGQGVRGSRDAGRLARG